MTYRSDDNGGDDSALDDASDGYGSENGNISELERTSMGPSLDFLCFRNRPFVFLRAGDDFVVVAVVR